MKALEGIRVIDFTHDQAGPACTQMLAWLGADVIKIERPGVGDRARVLYPGPTPNPESYFFLLMNSNKRSTVIDLKSEEGMAIARKMVEKADVVAENLGPALLVLDVLGAQPQPRDRCAEVVSDRRRELSAVVNEAA